MTLVKRAGLELPGLAMTTPRAFETLRPALPAQLLPTLLLIPKRCPKLLHRHHRAVLALASLLHTTRLSLFIRLSKFDIHFYANRQAGFAVCIEWVAEKMGRERVAGATGRVGLLWAKLRILLAILSNKDRTVGLWQRHFWQGKLPPILKSGRLARLIYTSSLWLLQRMDCWRRANVYDRA